MNLKPAEWARTVVYVCAFALGAYAFVHGVANGDPTNVASGLALIGATGLAVPNIPGVKDATRDE